MKPGFVIALLAALLLLLFFVVGLFANQPIGMLAYLCLSPFAFLAVGRTSVGLLRSRKVVLLTDAEVQRLRPATRRN